MTNIYIDESGDLGFNLKKKKPPSHYFTVAAICVVDSKEDKKLKRIMKKVRQRKLKKKLKNKPELKFSNSNRHIRKFILESLVKLNVSLYGLTIDKKKVITDLKGKPDRLNNYILKELLNDCLNIDHKKNLRINFDRCLPKKKQDELTDYINWIYSEKLSKIPKVNFNHVDSKEDKAIQVVDFVAGAIQQYYEHGNREYVDIIKDKLSHKPYFMPWKKI